MKLNFNPNNIGPIWYAIAFDVMDALVAYRGAMRMPLLYADDLSNRLNALEILLFRKAGGG